MYKIFLNSVPVLAMVGFIPLVDGDWFLAGLFGLVISVSFLIKREPNEWKIFIAGVLLMTFFEYVFILTGVEVFYRRSLLEVMPLWLPLLWGYGFVAIGRVTKIINS